METPKFTERFYNYVYEGDNISAVVDNITYTVMVMRDGVTNLPELDDERLSAEQREAWEDDEWFFCRIIIRATMRIDIPRCVPQEVVISENAASLEGIEANLPDADGNIDNARLNEAADELLPEAIEYVQTVMSKICAEFCVAAQNKQAAASI